MTSNGIFLEYQGPVDFPLVDSLLTELKSNKEYIGLSTLIRKRTYSLFVECIENICKHSSLKRADDKNLQPGVSVRKEANKVVIHGGNPVTEESRALLTKQLERVNSLDCDELKKLHEVRIDRDAVKGSNGAGLGFICMAFKSGNKISYSFQPLITGYLYFEIQISLNM